MSQYSERGEAREAQERVRARQLCGNRLSTIVNFIFPISTFLDTRSRISPTYGRRRGAGDQAETYARRRGAGIKPRRTADAEGRGIRPKD